MPAMMLAPLLFAFAIDTARAQADDAPILGPTATAEEIEAVNRAWRGVGVGYENGLWGSEFTQGTTLQIPFGRKLGQFFGARLRAQMSHSTDVSGDWAALSRAGLELFGRGPVLLGILRAYGGGGVYMGLPSESSPDPVITGGGHYGVEFAISDHVAFTFEVGGQGPTHKDLGGGASVMAGSTVYLGR